MKKIAIVTWCSWHNFGTFLQAYALQKTITSLGYQCSILDDRDIIFYKVDWKSAIKNAIKRFHPCYRHFLLNKSKGDARFDEFKLHFLKVDSDVNDKNVVSRRYDAFVCGSDQIWSIAGIHEARRWYYFAYFTDKPKIAYAPSGANYLPDNKRPIYRSLIKDFSAISVREPQAQNVLQSLTDKKVELVVDPTLLLDKQEWTKIADASSKQLINSKRYLLVYFLTSNQSYIDVARKYASEHRLRLVAFYIHRTYKQWADELITGGPLEFLSAIRNAECVFTDSFHGTIFSTIFERQFVLFKRFKETDNAKSLNSRIYHLMSMMGMPDRIIDESGTDKIEILPTINFDNVKEALQPYITTSKQFLIHSLNEI